MHSHFPDVYLQNPDILEGADDMVTLSLLHEPAILHNLSSRYKLDKIYTFTGTILIAVNPYKIIPGLYHPSMIASYYGKELGKMAPHVYAIANQAYGN